MSVGIGANSRGRRTENRHEIVPAGHEQWKVAAFTGHRFVENPEWVQVRLCEIADDLYRHHGTRIALSGMAMGSDLAWTRAAIAVGMEVRAYIPFPQQPDMWSDRDREEYDRLLHMVSSSKTFRNRYDVRAYHERDRAMVDDGDVVVSVLSSVVTGGGTKETVGYARRQKRPLIIVDPETRTVTATSTTPEATLFD